MFAAEQPIVMQFRVLIVVTIAFAWFMSSSESQVISLKEAVPYGTAIIHVSENNDKTMIPTSVIEKSPTEASMVVINEASFEQLIVLPGIGKKTASLMLSERNHRPFSDWRDLQDRVKGLGETKISNLRELGVRLDR